MTGVGEGHKLTKQGRIKVPGREKASTRKKSVGSVLGGKGEGRGGKWREKKSTDSSSLIIEVQVAC